jgi:hypothetical protein
VRVTNAIETIPWHEVQHRVLPDQNAQLASAAFSTPEILRSAAPALSLPPENRVPQFVNLAPRSKKHRDWVNRSRKGK